MVRFPVPHIPNPSVFVAPFSAFVAETANWSRGEQDMATPCGALPLRPPSGAQNAERFGASV